VNSSPALANQVAGWATLP